MLEPVRDIHPSHLNCNSSWPHPEEAASRFETQSGHLQRSETSVGTTRRIAIVRDESEVKTHGKAATMATIKLVVFLLIMAAANALPFTKVHVKFVSPPHTYEHDITTDGDRTVSQKSFVSIGRRSARKDTGEFGDRLNPLNGNRLTFIKPENAESLWPVGVFIPPVNINDLGYSSRESRHMTPDFSNGLEYYDPYLLTGEKAMLAVKYLYGHGELFYDDFPHDRAVLRNQEERILNGLDGHILKSLRPTSPFYRKQTA